MNILQVTPFFLPSTAYGGSVQCLYRNSVQLQRSGHNVTVITTNADINGRLDVPLSEPVDFEGFKVIYFPLGSRKNNYYPLRSRFDEYGYSSDASEYLTNHINDYDLVLINNCYTYFGWIIRKLYQKKKSPPCWIMPHGTLDPALQEKAGIEKMLYNTLFQRRNIANVTGLIACNQQEKNFISENWKAQEIAVIPNGINLEEMNPDAEAEEFRKKYLKDKQRCILFLGRAHWKKGVLFLIDIFSYIAKEFPDVVLAIAAREGDELSKAKALAKELKLENQVIFPDISGDQRWSALKASTFFTLLSESEGLPMAVLESCANACPVVITEECHVPEVEEYNAGLIVKRNPVTIANAFRKMLRQPDPRKEYGSNGVRMVKEKFDIKLVADMLANLAT